MMEAIVVREDKECVAARLWAGLFVDDLVA